MSFPNVNPWTDDEDKILREVWAKFSAVQCMEHLPGRSRNSIIGRAHRIGLAGAKTITVNPKRKKAEPMLKLKRAAQPLSSAVVVPFAPKIEPAVGPVTLHQLTDIHCRSVRDDAHDERGLVMYCGKVKLSGTPYCAEHARLYYNPRELSNRRASHG